MVENKNIDIWLIEDSPEYANSLEFLIRNLSGIQISNVYATLEEGISAAQTPFTILPDVVLLDHVLNGGQNGVDGLRLLKNTMPQTPILMLTSLDDTDLMAQSLANGASGYLLKSLHLDEIVHAIHQATRGGVYMPPGVAHKILGLFRKVDNGDKYKLTTREAEVLQQLARGLKQKEIADTLNISAKTVNNHLRQIYDKLHVNSGLEAVAKAYEEGLVKPRGERGS